MLEPRERTVLISGAVVLSLLLGYFFVLEPLFVQRQQLTNITQSQQKTLSWMQDAAVQIQQLRNQTTHSPTQALKQSLFSLIDESLQKTNLQKIDKRIEPRKDTEVRVNFDKVAFSELVKWLADLEAEYGVKVLLMTAEPLKQPDQVKVRMTLYVSEA
ncbi:type II secretion system protein M [Candidatus Albibeggiatoa sp. nov. NOAA]|uniref:type II secretion system protein M n=1 Tax=Candidatus Albibeggiatoa sp. nov. NOAA TaxID=3162724 RepID=UPI0032FF9B32|nr:type II secretion system protein M [Thiotrichaceae bacterium]